MVKKELKGRDLERLGSEDAFLRIKRLGKKLLENTRKAEKAI